MISLFMNPGNFIYDGKIMKYEGMGSEIREKIIS